MWLLTDPKGEGILVDHITQRERTYEKFDGPNIQPGKLYYIRVITYDTESRGAVSNLIDVRTQAKSWWEESSIQLLAIAGIAVAAVVIFAYMRARGVREGKPFRLRSSKAEGVVEERKGPKGKTRPPKEDAAIAAAVPAAPSKQSQDAVDYMQRVMKGGR